MDWQAAAAAAAAAGSSGARKRRVILWFRRDLRLADNPALCAALQMAPEVIPVYIWSPEEEGQFQPGRCSRWWLINSLSALEKDLQALGSRLLCYRASDALSLLARLSGELGAAAVVFNHLYDPISMVRDNEVKAGLVARGIFCQSFNAEILREPWEVLDQNGKPFTCYDAFWAAHCALPYPPTPPLPIPSALPGVPARLESAALKDLGIMSPEEEMSNAQLEFQWHPGSAGAHRLLDDFVRGGRLKTFDRDRAKTDRASTSRLSPHIHYGEISVRHIHYVAKHQELEWARDGEGGSSVKDFLRQLGYREYSRYLSFHFPFTHERSLLEHLRAVPWRFDQRLFKAWRQGRTGYPLVDAAMREVWGTGWMHNRMRVVAASFMVKHLLLPWQWGLKHYWDALLDADLECDALGWQYMAGCMADAHDFGSMVDHHTEAKRFDPDGHYVRRWLPVLARLPFKYIHEPWLAPESVLNDAGVELGANYPFPVISLEESKAALAAANAVVEQCLRSGAAGVGSNGPFRPATEAEPERAEQLFAENYRNSVLCDGGDAARQDLAEGSGASEDVQSNLVGTEDMVSCGQQAYAACSDWDGPQPSTTGAASAAPPLPYQLPERQRRLAGGPPGGQVGADTERREEQEHPAQQWQQMQPQSGPEGDSQLAGCPGGSGANGSGSGGGSGRATNTLMTAAVVPSLSAAAPSDQVPRAVPAECTLQKQQHVAITVACGGRQGSNDSPASQSAGGERQVQCPLRQAPSAGQPVQPALAGIKRLRAPSSDCSPSRDAGSS